MAFLLSMDAMFRLIPQDLFLTFTSCTANGKLPKVLTLSPTPINFLAKYIQKVLPKFAKSQLSVP